MRTPTILWPALVCAGLIVATCSRPLSAPRKADVVAEVGGRDIRLDEIDAAIQPELARIDTERYEARKTKLDEIVDESLLAAKAKGMGISPDELVRREITDRTPPPTDADVKATFEKFKGQTKASFDSLAPRIRSMLTSQATAVRRSEYLTELRRDAKVKVRLDPPRFAVDTAGGHVDGPADARITLVEFSDYQCPFCGRSQDIVAKVLDTYKGTIRHVFMDFPLTSIHPFAKLAAVASHCADEQAKYREYHRILFDRQRDFSTENFKKWATELGLDAARFDACLASDKFDAVIDQSLHAGQKVGVSGTPGFFVNGIPIHGAQPFTVFKKTIEEELARTG